VTFGIGRGLSRRRRMLSLCLLCRRRGRCLISLNLVAWHCVSESLLEGGGKQKYRVADQFEAFPHLLI
jgi:hypothetical protein